MKTKYEYYTIENRLTIKPDVCYGLCTKKDHDICKKEKECLMHLCSSDELKIVGFSMFHIIETGDDTKMLDFVKQWRKNKFKKCKKVTFQRII